MCFQVKKHYCTSTRPPDPNVLSDRFHLSSINGMEQIKDLAKLLLVTIVSFFSRQKLQRLPEPDLVTCGIDAVRDYEQVKESAHAIIYRINLLLISTFDFAHKGKILDLACGPGVFTSLATKELKSKEITVVDLSEAMLDSAKALFNSTLPEVNVRYVNSSIADLSPLYGQKHDLVMCMSASHHMRDHAMLSQMLKEAEKVCSDEGVVYISDLVRPKNDLAYKNYYYVIAKSNAKSGLDAHNLDFYHSLRAAWTSDELWNAIPKDSTRTWVQIVPRGLEFMQVLIGFPGNKEIPKLQKLKSDRHKELVKRQFGLMWHLSLFSFNYNSFIRTRHGTSRPRGS